MPAMVIDPHLPEGAPSAQAIELLSKEDGPQAGLALAEKALSLSQLANGHSDPRNIISQINVAHARQRAGMTADALSAYREIISTAESAGDARDYRLVAVWNGIAYAHLSAGNFESAQNAYANALHLARVNRGLKNSEQLDFLHALSVTQHAQGDFEKATETQLRRLDLSEYIHGPGSPEVAKAHIQLGRWHRQSGQIFKAISAHVMAAHHLSKTTGPRTAKWRMMLVESLIESARSTGIRALDFDRPPLPLGTQPAYSLDRSEKLVNSAKKWSIRDKARYWIKIGDVHLIQGREEKAMKLYSKARKSLASIGETPPFSAPAFIDYKLPLFPAASENGGHLIASFNVNQRGEVEGLKVSKEKSLEIPKATIREFRKAVHYSRFRPRIVGDKPVNTKDLRFKLRVPQ